MIYIETCAAILHATYGFQYFHRLFGGVGLVGYGTTRASRVTYRSDITACVVRHDNVSGVSDKYVDVEIISVVTSSVSPS